MLFDLQLLVCSPWTQLREQRRSRWWWRSTILTPWLCPSLWAPRTRSWRNKLHKNWASQHLSWASGNSLPERSRCFRLDFHWNFFSLLTWVETWIVLFFPVPSAWRHKEQGSKLLIPLEEEQQPGRTLREVAEVGRATVWCQVGGVQGPMDESHYGICGLTKRLWSPTWFTCCRWTAQSLSHSTKRSSHALNTTLKCRHVGFEYASLVDFVFLSFFFFLDGTFLTGHWYLLMTIECKDSNFMWYYYFYGRVLNYFIIQCHIW